jgi:hypothetical protein
MATTIFITGATSGLGEEMALEFARRGYAIAIAGRRIERLESLATRLRDLGAAAALAVPLDVTDYAAVEAALARVASELGRLDIVVANAGVGYSLPAGRGKFELLRQTIDTDLTAAIATIEFALPILRAQGGGQIVAITSVAGSRGMTYMGAYSAAKAGLHRYVQALRAELRGEPIVLTELAPGYIDTDMNRGMKSRPFVIPLEKGGSMLADMIERRVRHRFVPMWPWTLIAPLSKLVPSRLMAPPRKSRGSRPK